MKNSINYFLASAAPRIVDFPINLYRAFFSPDHGIFSPVFGFSRCRFYPSCSEYTLRAHRQYGLLKGSVLSLKRIISCGPWSEGGYDPVNYSN